MSQIADFTDIDISPEELFNRINYDNGIILLDVRNDEEYEAWKIEGRNTPPTIHMFYGGFVEDEESYVAQLPKDRPMVVVCAKGGASEFVADQLREFYNIPAVNLEGGMIAWGNFYRRQAVVTTENYSIYQVDRPSRGCLSYVLISQGQAALIDPARHAQQYMDFLAENEASLSLILDTHAHADHISGGPALAEHTGAPYYLHPYDGIHPFDMLPATIPFEMLKDGMQFKLGDLTIQAVHVPGHTLGLVNFLVTAPDGQTYLFTGDSIFINSFGRPDLGGQGQSWAPLVYQAIFEKIKSLVPGHALVLPGHYALHKEARQDGLYAMTLDELWQRNTDLQVGKEEFIEFVLTHLPNMPQQYIEIKRVNAGLSRPDEQQAMELELGKNVCALSTAY